MADVNLGQTATATLRNRDGEIADCVLNNNALLAWLKKKGKVQTKSGGRDFTFPVFYAENGTAKFYDGGMESFDIVPESVIDSSNWDRKFQAGYIYFTESERQSNKSSSQAVDLIEAKIENLKSTLSNDFATAVFGDGSAAKEIDGLQALVADDPTAVATVGGIAQGTYAWWRNVTDTSAAASASNIEGLMDGVWLSTIYGTEKPDLIVAGNNMFTYYKNALGANQRFIDWREADTLNFEGLKYQSATVLFDPNCATKRMYGLNTKYFHLICDSGRKWATLDMQRVTNALFDVCPVAWSGCLAVSARDRHFVIEGTS